MRNLLSISAAFLIGILLIQGCASYEVSESIAEIPPSLIYADNGSTLLGYYSNVGEKGPNLAPYFCASLEDDLNELLSQKDKNGKYIYQKKNGLNYDIYADELRIYTTINPKMQEHAEAAIREHLSTDLQPAFTENNSKTKRFPFSDTYNGKKVSDRTIRNIVNRAKKSSKRYQNLSAAGRSEQEIKASFDVPTKMKLFSWEGEIDTILSPNDSILCAKNLIRSSLLSLEPSTGHVKAWVGGIDFDHFPFDNIKTGKRQIGSAMKPFTYATAFSMGVAEPCTVFNKEEEYCVDPCDPSGRRWCPSGSPSHNVKRGFAFTSGGTTISIMSLMGACSGPQTLAKILGRMNIIVPQDQIVPSMCLGTPDMSLFEATAAYGTFVNNGIHVAPQSIRRIEDKHGNVIYSSKTISREIMNSMISYDVLQMMKLAVESGKCTSLRSQRKWGGIEHSTAAYAGTTQGNSDAWFFGLTPDLVTGVWTGGEDKQVRFRSMLWGQGARAALPIYGYYMQNVYSDSTLRISTEDFQAPKEYDPSRFNCESDETKNGEQTPFGVH